MFRTLAYFMITDIHNFGNFLTLIDTNLFKYTASSRFFWLSLIYFAKSL